MSSLSWKSHLRQTLLQLQIHRTDARIALVGIGHALCGDDAAGILLARLLRPLADTCPGLLVVCAGSAPENCTGWLRRHKPHLVILVDAAQLDEAPGAIRWIPSRMTSGLGASTHTLPLHVLAAYLEAELECEVILLGIQPSHLAFGPMSPQVRTCVRMMAWVLARDLCHSLSAPSGMQPSRDVSSGRRFDSIRSGSSIDERERTL